MKLYSYLPKRKLKSFIYRGFPNTIFSTRILRQSGKNISYNFLGTGFFSLPVGGHLLIAFSFLHNIPIKKTGHQANDIYRISYTVKSDITDAISYSNSKVLVCSTLPIIKTIHKTNLSS